MAIETDAPKYGADACRIGRAWTAPSYSGHFRIRKPLIRKDFRTYSDIPDRMRTDPDIRRHTMDDHGRRSTVVHKTMDTPVRTGHVNMHKTVAEPAHTVDYPTIAMPFQKISNYANYANYDFLKNNIYYPTFEIYVKITVNP